MEETAELANFLPLSFKAPKEQKDIEICAAFDIADEFDTHPNFPGIEPLHQTLRATYTEPEGDCGHDEKGGLH